MTITVDDAGSGDLLFGVIVGAFREETQEFKYGIIDVKYFKAYLFREKRYLNEASRVVFQLLKRLKVKSEEEIQICRGYIFDISEINLKRIHGDDYVTRIEVKGEAQRLTELSYLDEIRNLGYEPIEERETRRAKSFFHMIHWLSKNPEKLKYAKTGWPRLSRYRLFRSFQARRK